MEAKTIVEVLENRRAILKDHITYDKNLFNDPFLSQHSRGRVAVEEAWLKETESLLEALNK